MPGCMFFGGSGISATDFISAGTYKTWVIEVDYASGQQPDGTLLQSLDSALQAVVAPGKNVDVRPSSTALAASDRTWTVEALLELDASSLGAHTGGSTVVSHLIFIDGHAEQDNANEKVLGESIHAGLDHGLVVIFADTITKACQLPNCLSSQLPGIRKAVVIHEFGHQMGLVNNGIAMQTNREDPDHPHHSNNPNSVMYWAVESNAVLSILGGDPPSTFDANDKADLRAAGGR